MLNVLLAICWIDLCEGRKNEEGRDLINWKAV